MSGESVLETRDLTIDYPTRAGRLRAVDAVSLNVRRRETVAVVGESGCGKSSLAKAMVGLTPVTSGSLVLDGADVTSIGRSGWRKHRSAIQMVFQDPYSSLNPRHTVRRSLEDALRGSGRKKQEWETALADVLGAVGLRQDALGKHPHAFSGGQRQRIGIARALLMGATTLVCDEPVSALDLSVQAQILNLLADLKVSRGMTYVFISHDLGVVQHVADHVVVMYLGNIVESGPRERFWSDARHPYTEALFDAVPSARSPFERTAPLRGEIPSATRLPSGCVFHPRCPAAQAVCRSEKPALRNAGAGLRRACHLR